MSANEAQDVASEPLLCVLGWHNADPLALWNDGHYFSNCSRCGRDLVRTAFGRWTVPKGVQVVWSAQPPHGREPVRLSPDKDASARRTRIEFPIAEPAGIAGEVEAAAEKRMAVEDVPVMFAPEATESESTEVEAWNGLPISLDLRRSTRWARPAEPARSDERRIAMAGELPIQQVPRTLHDDAAPPQMRAADEPLTWFPDLEQDDEPYVLRTNSDAAFADAVPEEARSRDEPSSEPEDEAGSIASLAARSAP